MAKLAILLEKANNRIYYNAAGIQSAEKQAQKLASPLALKEFKWDE